MDAVGLQGDGFDQVPECGATLFLAEVGCMRGSWSGSCGTISGAAGSWLHNVSLCGMQGHNKEPGDDVCLQYCYGCGKVDDGPKRGQKCGPQYLGGLQDVCGPVSPRNIQYTYIVYTCSLCQYTGN
jgi:hypothetical protein